MVDVISLLSEVWNRVSTLTLVESCKILLEREASHNLKEPPKVTDNKTRNEDTQHISLLKHVRMLICRPRSYSRKDGKR